MKELCRYVRWGHDEYQPATQLVYSGREGDHIIKTLVVAAFHSVYQWTLTSFHRLVELSPEVSWC